VIRYGGENTACKIPVFWWWRYLEAKYRLKYRCKIPLARRDKLYFMPDPADDKKSAKKKTKQNHHDEESS
jgi:hypothetical protein